MYWQYKPFLCWSNGSINYTVWADVRLFVSLELGQSGGPLIWIWVSIKSRTTTTFPLVYWVVKLETDGFSTEVLITWWSVPDVTMGSMGNLVLVQYWCSTFNPGRTSSTMFMSTLSFRNIYCLLKTSDSNRDTSDVSHDWVVYSLSSLLGPVRHHVRKDS